MKRKPRTTPTASRKASSRRSDLTLDQLDTMVEEATVDCHDLEEQLSGLFGMLEEHLDLPFATRVLGVEVNVVDIAFGKGNTLVAAIR